MTMGTRYQPSLARATVASGNNTTIIATDDVTAIDQPGSAFQDQLGNWYRYALNDSTVTAAGDLMTASYATCGTDNGVTAYKIEVTADGSLGGPFALALGAITAARWGYVGIKGLFTAHIKGTVAVGDALAASAATALKVVKIADAAPPPICIGSAVAIATDADAEIILNGLNG